ncbi:hypothetical protein HWV62_7966 [Athelia sp. TMB]|nr:hypothetical protein HWV62_7966 [Athelia sp. TMB]
MAAADAAWKHTIIVLVMIFFELSLAHGDFPRCRCPPVSASEAIDVPLVLAWDSARAPSSQPSAALRAWNLGRGLRKDDTPNRIDSWQGCGGTVQLTTGDLRDSVAFRLLQPRTARAGEGNAFGGGSVLICIETYQW